ncbi:hypothetical protein KAW96_07010 [candidate division WOR-3 bacterium]|nr:hypothetical protein [candidate division WOR-3 bacterium]
MKKISYKDIEDFLDGEKSSLKKEEIKEDKRFKETLELFTMLKNLSGKPAPRNFERNLYRRLGIFYFPVYKKVLSFAGLSVFAATVYLSAHGLFNFIIGKINLARIPHQLSLIYSRIMQLISLIKAGNHLKDIYLAFTNPLLLLTLAFVSSILMLILIGLSREVKKRAVLLSRF